MQSWLISAVLITVTGYYTFDAKFIGTWPDFVQIALWAFCVDVGIDTATRLVGQFKLSR